MEIGRRRSNSAGRLAAKDAGRGRRVLTRVWPSEAEVGRVVVLGREPAASDPAEERVQVEV